MSYLKDFLRCIFSDCDDLLAARHERSTAMSELKSSAHEVREAYRAQADVAEATHKETRDAIHEVRNLNQIHHQKNFDTAREVIRRLEASRKGEKYVPPQT